MKIRSLLLILLIGFILPSFASAITADELTAKIKDLEQQLEQLKAQLAEIQTQPAEWCHDFNQSLKIENSGGAFLQWRMMETIFLGRLFGVDAFSQPDVEVYKCHARFALGGEN